MSTHVPEFQSFFFIIIILLHFVLQNYSLAGLGFKLEEIQFIVTFCYFKANSWLANLFFFVGGGAGGRYCQSSLFKAYFECVICYYVEYS